MSDPDSFDHSRARPDLELPRVWTLLAHDRRSMLALGFLLLSTTLLVVALVVGFDLYEQTDMSSGVALGLIVVPCLAVWTIALVIGSLVPTSGVNRALCAVLQKSTGAAHVWPLTESASVGALIARATPGADRSSATWRKMLLAVGGESLSFWIVQHRTVHSAMKMPMSSLLDATAQADPAAGSPLAMKICLTLRASDGARTDVEFTPRPTTMHLLNEPQTFAATLRTFIAR